MQHPRELKPIILNKGASESDMADFRPLPTTVDSGVGEPQAEEDPKDEAVPVTEEPVTEEPPVQGQASLGLSIIPF